MRFIEWMRLDEIQHVSLPSPMVINGIATDAIDFRFEDWGKGFNPDKLRHGISPAINGSRFMSGNFSVPLNNRQWLNIDHGEEKPDNTDYLALHNGNFALALRASRKANPLPKTQIEIGKLPKFQTLPNTWIYFAILLLHGQVVKSPEWPRNKAEMMPLSTAELE